MPSNSSFHSFETQSMPSRDRGKYKKMEKKPFIIRWKSGKRVDPRLVEMLETFRELYEKREEFFKRIFPRSHNEFADVFKKIGAVVSAKTDHGKIQTMQRSLSLGSPRSPSQVGESELRLNRFKVRTPAVVVVRTGGQGGGASSNQGGTMTSGSK